MEYLWRCFFFGITYFQVRSALGFGGGFSVKYPLSMSEVPPVSCFLQTKVETTGPKRCRTIKSFGPVGCLVKWVPMTSRVGPVRSEVSTRYGDPPLRPQVRAAPSPSLRSRGTCRQAGSNGPTATRHFLLRRFTKLHRTSPRLNTCLPQPTGVMLSKKIDPCETRAMTTL